MDGGKPSRLFEDARRCVGRIWVKILDSHDCDRERYPKSGVARWVSGMRQIGNQSAGVKEIGRLNEESFG